ncbi:MAG TPA: hypothetical protein VJ488_06050 [Dehalococcoidia bacterium]|nr:hypothetical protein [Dehalococcoidia bacterium]
MVKLRLQKTSTFAFTLDPDFFAREILLHAFATLISIDTWQRICLGFRHCRITGRHAVVIHEKKCALARSI